jgi:general secretion pathway protein A
MFLNYYQLHEQPFGVTPDPKYTYFTSTHREALASLAYAVEVGSGFAVMVAKPGMGKTTLLFRLLDYLQDKARTVFVFHTQCNSVDLLRYILSDMKIRYSGKDLVEMHALLNDALLSEARAGRTVVIAIDESQNLSHEVLETIRLLSDFETPRRKLLQIILCGQPQLGHKLAHPDLVQLRQRITVLCRLSPLSLQEVTGYIDHRLQVAGHTGRSLFTPEAVRLIASESRGIPRVINTLCSNAISIGCALGRYRIDPEVIQEVLADLSVDSLIEEMAAQEASTNLIPMDEDDQLETTAAYADDESLPQEITNVLAAPTPETLTAQPDDVALLRASEVTIERPSPDTQTFAAMLKHPEPQVLPAAAAPAEPELPATSDTAMPHGLPHTTAPLITGIAAAAKQFRPFAQRAMRNRVLKDKGEWIVGMVFLAASLLGLTLRFGTSGSKPGYRPAIIPDSASAGSLSSAAAGPTHTVLPVNQGAKNLPAEQTPVDKHKTGGDAVVHVVQTNETLSEISVAYLGHYDSAVLQEVQKDNADLKDPDLIRVGQRVLMPPRPAVAGDEYSSEKKVSGSIEGKP